MDDDFRQLRNAAIREMIREHRRETIWLWTVTVASVLVAGSFIVGLCWAQSKAPTLRQFIDGN